MSLTNSSQGNKSSGKVTIFGFPIRDYLTEDSDIPVQKKQYTRRHFNTYRTHITCRCFCEMCYQILQ